MSYIKTLVHKKIEWDNTEEHKWKDIFTEVDIKSKSYTHTQKAMFHKATKKAPLLISLHTWGGDYKQYDPLALKAANEGWNYIHPDTQGPNYSLNACLSGKVVSDFKDALDYAISNGNVDEENIFVVGASGGGYTALGTYLQVDARINSYLVWVPITDLNLWYKENLSKNNSRYTSLIKSCTAGEMPFSQESAKMRSPLQFKSVKKSVNLELYAGINDGHSGSVPISHSLLFFNKLAVLHEPKKEIKGEEIVQLLNRAYIKLQKGNEIGKTSVYFYRSAGPVSITIFEGAHEMKVDYTFERLKSLVKFN